MLSEAIQRQYSGIRPLKSTTGVVDLEATDDAPQIIFKPNGAFPAGWYSINLEIEAVMPSQPQVFFDFGGGFNQIFSIFLKRHAGGIRYSAVFKLPFPAETLRLDPAKTAYAFSIRSFRIRRISNFGSFFILGRLALRMVIKNPRGFLGRVPNYMRALRRPTFIQLRDRMEDRGGNGSYATWIKRHDFDIERDLAEIASQVGQLKTRPLISALMPVYNTPARFLDEAIASVAAQIYPHWQLCIADDHSTEPHVRAILERWQSKDSRIKVVLRGENGHISRSTNSAFALATGEWIALLDHDDLLRPHALAEVALEIDRHPKAEIIYSDEDKLDSKGKRYEPYFKPDFSRELFRSQNYFNHLTVHRASNIRAVGGWRPGFEGSQDYDLNLRIFERIDAANIRHIPKILYHWRAVEGSTAMSGTEKNYAFAAGLRALESHVERLGLQATVEPSPGAPFYRLRHKVPDPQPLVSLIVPTRDRVDLLKGCIDSILQKTAYLNYDITIVDNGSVEEQTLAYFDTLKDIHNICILPYEKPFNYSAINNFAVDIAKGEIVGLINNDVEVISPGWLTEMVSWAIQPDIGCVGAKLYYADDTIQHAGVILGIGGVAAHAHINFPRQAAGYFGRATVINNFSAVTGACLLIRKDVYQKVGGLNSKELTIAFNDVDFCLRVSQSGLVNVFTPYAELYHFESKSRGAEDTAEKIARFTGEVRYMQGRWGRQLKTDPYYSPHLSKRRPDFSIGD